LHISNGGLVSLPKSFAKFRVGGCSIPHRRPRHENNPPGWRIIPQGPYGQPGSNTPVPATARGLPRFIQPNERFYMKRLLIDAAHAEETRVVLLADQRIDDFESESSGKQQHKGNIYIGHVSRVEPSLQAAFIT